MLWSCGRPWLLGSGLWVLRRAVGSWWGSPFNAVVKRLVFPHYCAGERLQDCHRVATSLQLAGDIRLVVDHSQEEREAPEDWAINLDGKVKLLESLNAELGERVSFVPFKATSIMSPALLESMTAIIMREERWCETLVDPMPRLGDEERRLLEAAEANFTTLCLAAQTSKVSLWLDAEQSNRQPAIDFIATRLMKRFNTVGEKPIIFNTYQLYLVGADARLKRDLAAAIENNYSFAAKCVRGAYMVTEAERARELGVSSPIHATKENTDRSFDVGVAAVLEAISVGHDAHVAICTHNFSSVSTATAKMQEFGIRKDSERVQFAQILGMSDHLTGALGSSGYRAYKLVLFGDYLEVFPWLLRRIDENRDMLGACQSERPLLKKEIWRRLLG